MVYSADGIPVAEALAAQKRLAPLLSYKLKWEYLEMCGFVRANMSLAIVRSNSLFLRGPCDKGARIRQRPELTDGVLMAVISPRRGKIYERLIGWTGGKEVKDSDRVPERSQRIARESSESAFIWHSNRGGKREVVGIVNSV